MIELTAATPLGAGEVRPAAWPPGFRGVSSDCGARLCMVVPAYLAAQLHATAFGIQWQPQGYCLQRATVPTATALLLIPAVNTQECPLEPERQHSNGMHHRLDAPRNQ